jgi:hypothetical protein
MMKKNYTFLLVLLASLLLSLLYIPKYNEMQADKEIFRYVGVVILKGGVPYRDVFDHKPPLIFFLNYAALLLGGDWGQWAIDTCLMLLATALFFRLCSKHRLPFPWLPPLLFNLMLRDHLLCMGMGMTREYTTIFLLIFFCVLMERSRYRYFLLGSLCGLIFFMQQDQVFALLPFFLYALLPDQDTLSFWSRILRIGAGFAAVTLPIILYFAWHHSLSYFWQDAFLFNFTWYTTTLKATVGDHLRRLKYIFDMGNYEVPVLVVFTLGLCALFLRTSNRRLILVALAAALLSLFPEFMGGRETEPIVLQMSFTHYVLPLSATLSILLFCVFAFSEEPIIRGRNAQGIYGFFVCISLAYIALQHGAHLTDAKLDTEAASLKIDYLRQQKPGDYQVYSFGDNNFDYAYNEFRILAPSKWVYHHFWYLYDNWDRDHAILYSISEDLLRHHTTYVIDSGRPRWFRDRKVYDWWEAFLQKHYEPVLPPVKNDSSTLWRLKTTQP